MVMTISTVMTAIEEVITGTTARLSVGDSSACESKHSVNACSNPQSIVAHCNPQSTVAEYLQRCYSGLPEKDQRRVQLL